MRRPDAEGWLTLDGTPFDEQEFLHLWLVATATYGVGDVVTTIALVEFSRSVAEGNLLLRRALEAFGQAGLVGLKLAVFLCCLSISVYAANRADRFLYYLPPATLSVVGAFTTAYNLRLLVA